MGGRTRDRIGPGDYFGEISLVDREPRTGSVVADTPLRTLSIANFNFRVLLREHPELTYKLLLQMCRLFRAERALHL